MDSCPFCLSVFWIGNLGKICVLTVQIARLCFFLEKSLCRLSSTARNIFVDGCPFYFICGNLGGYKKKKKKKLLWVREQ